MTPGTFEAKVQSYYFYRNYELPKPAMVAEARINDNPIPKLASATQSRLARLDAEDSQGNFG
ncbi:MAG: hypothetical protein ACI8W8_003865 [Rhodothermales bacterium]|jgi:hypothetical protein